VESHISSLVDFVVEGEPGGGEASAVVDLSGGRVQLLRSTAILGREELFRLKR
jgi:tRNA A37 threonylcarbamoyladenosine synthetase subunit TsaC/SUA5/YrdC